MSLYLSTDMKGCKVTGSVLMFSLLLSFDPGSLVTFHFTFLLSIPDCVVNLPFVSF